MTKKMSQEEPENTDPMRAFMDSIMADGFTDEQMTAMRSLYGYEFEYLVYGILRKMYDMHQEIQELKKITTSEPLKDEKPKKSE